jgi:transcriptional regulator NrdR family protein
MVIDSRSQRSTIRRRRKCNACGFRFSTYEIPDSLFATLKNLVWMKKALHEASVVANTVAEAMAELDDERAPEKRRK